MVIITILIPFGSVRVSALPLCECYDDEQCDDYTTCDQPGDRCCTACRAQCSGGEGDFACGSGFACNQDLFCDTNDLKCKYQNGHTCSANSDCLSGYCVDGYCCNSACTGTCQACNLAGNLGTCTTRSADDNTECGTCERCDGTNPNCQDVTADSGKNCNTECTRCSSGSCVARNDDVECGTCRYCLTGSTGDCSALTADDGKNCNEECTRCNGGSCVTRSADDNTECSTCERCDGTPLVTCAAVTANNGKNCNEECTRCFGGTCVTRIADDNTECGTCRKCDGTPLVTCAPATADNGKNCNDDCTYCSSGSCVNRPQCANNECASGQYCNVAGGDCTNPDTNSQTGENTCEACVTDGEHPYGEGWAFEAGTPYCCSDDSGEYYEYCRKDTGSYSISWSCTSGDDICCDATDDCVDPGDDSCKTKNLAYDVSGAPSNDNYAYCYDAGDYGQWRDCDNYYSNCGATYCGSASGVYCGDGSGCSSLGEYSDGSTLECCGDDTGEEYRTATDYSASYPMAWNTGQTACCDDDNDCVDRIDNCVTGMYSGDYGNPTTGLNPGGNDNIAFPYNNNGAAGYCRWLDCDQSDFGERWCRGHCGPTTPIGGSWADDRNRPFAGESGVGEYPDTSTRGCCGDDAGEYYVYFKTRGSAGADVVTCDDVTDEFCVNGGRNETDNACCNYNVANNEYDCVYDGGCVSEGQYRDLDGDGAIDGWCMTSDSYQGNWRDCDSDSGACNGGCGHDWATGGESSQFGEYDTGTSTECCGDDYGENYRYCQGSSGFPDSGDCTTSDDACCNNANDCVTADGTTCVVSGTTSTDGDGDGDNDYCNAGTWYECNTDLQCPSGYICSSNDCVVCTADDCASPSCRDGTAGCCDEDSDCTGNDDDFCQNYNAGDENANNNPAGDSDTEAGNIELATRFVCAPAKHINRGTEASTTDGFNLNTKYSRTQSYAPDINWWQFNGDGMVTAQTSYTTSDTDLCFVYNYDPCAGSDGTIYYENGAGARGDVGTMDQGYPISSGCSTNWVWINFGSGTYGNTVGKDVLGSTNGLMKIAMFSYGDYMREWQFGWRKSEVGATDGSNSYWCCDSANDCVDDAPSQGSRVSGDPDSRCYNTGSFRNTGGGDGADREQCRSGTWYAQDDDQTACENDGNLWNIGGDISNCCEDDSGENIRTSECDGYMCTSDPSDDACCNQASDCVWESTCYDNGVNHPTFAGAYCVNGVWEDTSVPSITIILPDPGWKNSDFEVKARVTDNGDVDSVWYHWENLTNVGPTSTMSSTGSNEYSRMFPVYSVSPGNYTIKISANDTMGNEDSRTISNVGIDYVKPYSQMTEPAPPGGGYVTDLIFNISWSGSDQHSGVKCHNIYYEYCPPGGPPCSGEMNVNFYDSQCTGSTPPYEFDARDTGIENLNGYTFYFKSRAEDNADNLEDDKNWETNITIFIPQLITFSVKDDVTKRNIMNYGGRAATNRTVVIDVQAKEDFGDNLNIEICHYNRTLGGTLPDPSDWYCKTCADTRSCNKSIRTIVSSAEERIEVDYYIYAENASGTSISEFLPPGGYFYYTVYHHPLCNFLVKDILKTILGSSELIPIEVRNIQDGFDMVGLRFSTASARFVETNSRFIEVPMNPSEEKIIYARLVSPADNFQLVLIGNSTLYFSVLEDIDEITVMIGFPPDFSGLSVFGILVLIVLATFIYLKFVRIEN